MKKYIILNADDFGMTEGCNKGIIKAMKEGIVTSTSIMMNMPKTDHGIELAYQHGIQAMGVHINISQGPSLLPMEEVSSLVDENGRFSLEVRDGNLNNMSEFIIKLSEREIEKESREQIERFRRFGLKLSHLDTHNSIHMRRKFRYIFIKLANEYGVPLRKINYGKTTLKRRIYEKYIRRDIYRSANRFTTQFYEEGVSMDVLKSVILEAPAGVTEIMCHPGFVDDELMAISGYNTKRGEELEILTSVEMKNWISDHHISLVSYDELFNVKRDVFINPWKPPKKREKLL